MSYCSPGVNESDTSLEDVSEYVPPDTSLDGYGDTCTDGTSTIKEKKDAVVAEVLDGLSEEVVDEVVEEDKSKEDTLKSIDHNDVDVNKVNDEKEEDEEEDPIDPVEELKLKELEKQFLELKIIDVVGVSMGSNGRSCTTHSCCGEHVPPKSKLILEWGIQSINRSSTNKKNGGGSKGLEDWTGWTTVLSCWLFVCFYVVTGYTNTLRWLLPTSTTGPSSQ